MSKKERIAANVARALAEGKEIVYSDIHPDRVLIYDHDKPCTMSMFDDELDPELEAALPTLEETYSQLLKEGKPRIPDTERYLDMSQIDDELLDAAPSLEEWLDER
jgi:hypothetical protein